MLLVIPIIRLLFTIIKITVLSCRIATYSQFKMASLLLKNLIAILVVDFFHNKSLWVKNLHSFNQYFVVLPFTFLTAVKRFG